MLTVRSTIPEDGDGSEVLGGCSELEDIGRDERQSWE